MMITTSPTLVLGEYQNDTRVLSGYHSCIKHWTFTNIRFIDTLIDILILDYLVCVYNWSQDSKPSHTFKQEASQPSHTFKQEASLER